MNRELVHSQVSDSVWAKADGRIFAHLRSCVDGPTWRQGYSYLKTQLDGPVWQHFGRLVGNQALEALR